MSENPDDDKGLPVHRNFFKQYGPYIMVPISVYERGRWLSSRAKLMWAVLKSFENRKNKQIFPSYDKLQERSGLSRGSISLALEELETFGWLKKRKRFGHSTVYKLLIPEAITPTKEENKAWLTAKRKERTANRNRHGDSNHVPTFLVNT